MRKEVPFFNMHSINIDTILINKIKPQWLLNFKALSVHNILPKEVILVINSIYIEYERIRINPKNICNCKDQECLYNYFFQILLSNNVIKIKKRPLSDKRMLKYLCEIDWNKDQGRSHCNGLLYDCHSIRDIKEMFKCTACDGLYCKHCLFKEEDQMKICVSCRNVEKY